MITGNHLFSGGHEYDIFQKAMQLRYMFPKWFDELACDLVKRLVVREPGDRIGAGSYADLKAHGFFKGINWSDDFSQGTVP